jgi:hypothetical protein
MVDEGMDNLATTDLPPNVLHLQHVQNDTPLLPETVKISALPRRFTLQPFTMECDICIPVCCMEPTFDFRLNTDTATNCAYLSKILPASTTEKLCSSARVTQCKYIGAFVTSIADSPVYTTAKASCALHKLATASNCLSHVLLTLAPEPLPSSHDCNSALQELDIFSALAR